MKELIYLDYNASTPLRPGVIGAMTECFQHFGNPSSIHGFGRKARACVESARDILAEKLDVIPAQVVFTSGGTEANNFCLRAALLEKRDVFISAIEHESIHQFAPNAKTIPVIPEGIIDLEKLDQHLAAAPFGKSFVSVMLANNETGICQPIKEVAAIVRRYQGRLHCDAVTAFTKLPFTYKELGVDYLSLSSHKIGGPKGAGALIVRSDEQLPSLILGGGQEKGHRAGTENVTGIVGFAQAIKEANNDPWNKIEEFRNALESTITRKYPSSSIYGKSIQRLPNTSTIRMPGVPALKQLLAFDLDGFALSAGSACSSGKAKPSHVLKAMGASEEECSQTIRVSLGWQTTKNEIEQFANAWLKVYERFLNRGKE